MKFFGTILYSLLTYLTLIEGAKLCMEKCNNDTEITDNSACYDGCKKFDDLKVNENLTQDDDLKKLCIQGCEEKKDCIEGCTIAADLEGVMVDLNLWNYTKLSIARIVKGVSSMIDTVKVTIIKIFYVLTSTVYSAHMFIPLVPLYENSSNESVPIVTVVEKEVHQEVIGENKGVFLVDSEDENLTVFVPDSSDVHHLHDVNENSDDDESTSGYSDEDSNDDESFSEGSDEQISDDDNNDDSANNKKPEDIKEKGDRDHDTSEATEDDSQKQVNSIDEKSDESDISTIPWYVIRSPVEVSEDSPYMLAVFIIIVILVVLGLVILVVVMIRKRRAKGKMNSGFTFPNSSIKVTHPEDLKPIVPNKDVP